MRVCGIARSRRAPRLLGLDWQIQTNGRNAIGRGNLAPTVGAISE